MEKNQKHEDFISTLIESNEPPKVPTLDWFSLRYDVYNKDQEYDKVEGTFDFLKEYAKDEKFVLKELSSFIYERKPEFKEQDRMLLPSPVGFFEDTPENAVKLFSHVFKDTGFNLYKLKSEVPADLSSRIIDDYLIRPRTEDDYCNEVWALHRSAVAKLAKQANERQV